MTNRISGTMLALFSAVLFGLSPVLAKLIIGEMSPILLAGLLYLGSGLGICALLLFARNIIIFQELIQLSARQKTYLLGATLFGGILAPICFAYGIKFASAFEVSVLLNFETVASTLFAALLFKEHVSRRVWISKALFILGALILIVKTDSNISFSIPGLLILGACLFWGLDNNLTREVEDLSPLVLSAVKGLFAGIFNIGLGYLFFKNPIEFTLLQTGGALGIGAISYGLSLVLFIGALRMLGTSRTSTYFATGPFWGMLLSIVVLGEKPSIQHYIAGLVMSVGMLILYRENHEHFHDHKELTHKHSHIHDEHHQHEHSRDEGPEPHDHLHTHKPLRHSHVHWPDIHHRHRHGQS